MTFRVLCATSLLALASACSQQSQITASGGDAAVTRGYDAYKNQNYAVAQQEFSSALAMEPDNSYAMLGLGAVSEIQGDVSSAVRYYSAAELEGRGDITTVTYTAGDGRDRERSAGVSELAAQNLGRVYQSSAYRASLGYGAATPATAYATQGTTMLYADPQATQPVSEVYYASPAAAAPITTTSFAVSESYVAPSATSYEQRVSADYTLDSGTFYASESYASPSREVVATSYAETVAGDTVDYNSGNYVNTGAYFETATVSSLETIGHDSGTMSHDATPVYAPAPAYQDTMSYATESIDVGTTVSTGGGQYQVIGAGSVSYGGDVAAESYGVATPTLSAAQVDAARYGAGEVNTYGGTDLIYLGN